MGTKLQKLQHFLSGWLEEGRWRGIDLSWRLETGIHLKVRNRVEWIIYNDIFVEGEYAPAIDRLLDSASPNPLVLDIGGNVGLFAQYLAHRWRLKHGTDNPPPFRLVGFEGTPETHRELLTRLDQPTLRENATYHRGLVGQRSGEGYISTSFFHGSNSIMGQRSRFGASVPFIDVEAVLPPDDRIALLKCDIEGAEELFLENYPNLLKRVDCAVFELHYTRCDVDRCVALLAEAGLTRRTVLRDCRPEYSVDLFER